MNILEMNKIIKICEILQSRYYLKLNLKNKMINLSLFYYSLLYNIILYYIILLLYYIILYYIL